MILLRSVVGKLWMTIIALVAVVLIILGLFLFRFIDTTFPDQTGSLQHLADKLAGDVTAHARDEAYVTAMNDLLKAEDAGIILLDLSRLDKHDPSLALQGARVPLSAVFTSPQLQSVYAGKRVTANYTYTGPNGKEDYLVLAVPLQEREQKTEPESLVLFQSKKSAENLQKYVKEVFAYVSLIGFLLTTFFAFFLITRINRPLLELKNAAGLFTRGDYGRRVPVNSSDEIGELSGAFNLMGDQLEETIRDLNHEKENLDSVLRSMGDAVISFDVDGRIIFINPEGERLLEDWSQIEWERVTDDAVLEGPSEQTEVLAAQAPHPPQYRLIPEPLLPIFRAVVQETREVATKIHVRNAVWSVVMAPLYSHEVVRGAVVVLRDVTEEYRLDKMRKDFVANVSHELRTPLSMLQGYSEALLDDIAASPEERKELAQIIHDESLRMGRLVKDLLDLARMETGHMEFQFREVDMEQLLRRVHRKFSALCKEQGISLELDRGSGGTILQKADEDRLEQVLTNLMDNAIRHTPTGAAIRIRMRPQALKGRRALGIQVEDEGQGIPADDLPYIFERFYKADKARTRAASGGTGLGLAIAKNIVEAHQGTIQVRSKRGIGTTFSIVLPV